MNGKPPRRGLPQTFAQLNLNGTLHLQRETRALLQHTQTAAAHAEVNQPKAPKRTTSGGDENQPAVISPFAGGKAFPARMDADAMTLAAGAYFVSTVAVKL